MNRTRTICALIALVFLFGAFASSAVAQVRPTFLNDATEPGSAIVFPKFVRGFVTVPGEATPQPRTEFEVGVVCPKGQLCPEGQKVKIRFHYVCGSSEASINSSFVCRETDFDLFTTVNGKLVFNTEGLLPGNTLAPQPQCDRGYLIAWVIDTSDRPIKFDGLIGDAVLRETGTAVGAYTAIPIQADPLLATNAFITLGPGGALPFDGGAGHYQAVTGSFFADVAFDRAAAAGPPVVGSRTTLLTLLTLDVRSNRPNYPTFVDLNFYNSNEQLLSTSTEFICWQEVSLSGINDGVGGVPLPAPPGAFSINTTLTGPLMNTRKGIVVAGPAEKVPIFGILDTPGPVTLLGLVEVLEGATATTGADRQFFYQMLNDSNPIPTVFAP